MRPRKRHHLAFTHAAPLLLAAGLAIGGISPLAHATKLLLITENTPPINMLENGKMIGANTDKVRELMRRAKVDFSLDPLPWKRGYLLASKTANTCIYPTARTPERESMFHWIGPISVGQWQLYAAADRLLPLKNIEQARPYLIGTYLDDARDEYFRSRGYRVESVSDDALNPKKLLVHRIDLWAASSTKGKLLLQQNGWSNKIVPVLTFNSVDIYLACNINTDADLSKRLNTIVAEMKADGTIKAMEIKYGE